MARRSIGLALLAGLAFLVRRVEGDKERMGRVLAQRPRPGARLPHRARVNLVIGRSAPSGSR